MPPELIAFLKTNKAIVSIDWETNTYIFTLKTKYYANKLGRNTSKKYIIPKTWSV